MHLGALILFIFFSLTEVRADLTATDIDPNNNVCGVTDFTDIMNSDCVRNFNLALLSNQTTERDRNTYVRNQFQNTCQCLASENTSIMGGAVSAIGEDINYARIVEAAREDTCRKFEAVHGIVQDDLTLLFPSDPEFLRNIRVESREVSEQASVCHEEESEQSLIHERAHEIQVDNSSTVACIPSRNFRAFMKTPQFDDIFSYIRNDRDSQRRESWNYNDIKRKLADLTQDFDLKGQGYGAVFEDGNPVLEGIPQEKVREIRLYLEQLRFLRYNPVFKYTMMLNPENPGVATQQTRMLEAFRNVIISGVDPNCFNDGNPHSCKDSFLRNKSYDNLEQAFASSLDPSAFQQGGLLTRILEQNATEASEQQVNIEATPALYDAFLKIPVDESLCRATGFLNGVPSSQIDDRCTRTMGMACGILGRLPRNYREYRENRSSPLIDALELSSEDQEREAFNQEICNKAWPPRRGNGPSLSYTQFEARICGNAREPRCENGQVREGERQNILAQYLEEYQTENEDLRNFFRKTRMTYVTPAQARYISGGGRVVDAFNNFNVDLPSDWNSRTQSSTRSTASSSTGSTQTQTPDQQSFNFASAAQTQTPFMPSSSALSAPITSAVNFEEESTELREARIDREQREEAFENKESELARAREEGANQERLRSMERELASLRSALEDSGRRYERLLQDVANRAEQPAASRNVAGADAAVPQTPTPARTTSGGGAISPSSQTFVRAPTPDLTPAVSNVAPASGQNFSPGSASFGSGGVSAAASASAAQALNSALADRYLVQERGSESSLVVRETSLRGSNVRIPVPGEIFSQVREGNYDQLEQSVRSQLGASASAGTYYLEVQSQNDSAAKTQIVAVIGEGGSRFYTLDQYSALQNLQSEGRRPASVTEGERSATLLDLQGTLAPGN